MGAAMASRKHRRAVWATGLSLVGHLLALSGMALGLRVLTPPPEGRAVEVRLIALEPRPAPARRAPGHVEAASSPPPRPTPRPASEAPAAAPPETVPAPIVTPGGTRGAGGLPLDLGGRLGCDDPQAFHLTADQRQACADRLAQVARDARPLALDIPERKKADYDRYAHCQEVYWRAPVPSMNPNDSSSGALPTGAPPANVNPTFGTNSGMGHAPPACWRENW